MRACARIAHQLLRCQIVVVVFHINIVAQDTKWPVVHDFGSFLSFLSSKHRVHGAPDPPAISSENAKKIVNPCGRISDVHKSSPINSHLSKLPIKSSQWWMTSLRFHTGTALVMQTFRPLPTHTGLLVEATCNRAAECIENATLSRYRPRLLDRMPIRVVPTKPIVCLACRPLKYCIRFFF